jgi:hypothetical protein
MSTKVIDIVGEKCYGGACEGTGRAKVVWYEKGKNVIRYFYGCDASTEERKCPGTKRWNSIQVPENLKEPRHRKSEEEKSKKSKAQDHESEG